MRADPYRNPETGGSREELEILIHNFFPKTIDFGIIPLAVRLTLIILIVLLGGVAMFAIQNPGIVSVRFLNYYADTSILIVIVASFGVGVLVGLLPGIPTAFRRKRRIRELEADLAAHRKSQPPPPPVTP